MTNWKGTPSDNLFEFSYDSSVDSNVTGSNIELGTLPLNFIVQNCVLDITEKFSASSSGLIGEENGDADGYSTDICALNTGVADGLGALVLSSSNRIPHKVASTKETVVLVNDENTAFSHGAFVIRFFGYQA